MTWRRYRAKMESRMDFTGAVCACTAAIREGWRGDPWYSGTCDGAFAALFATRKRGVRGACTEAGI